MPSVSTRAAELQKKRSGSHWVSKFPGSSQISALRPPFRNNVERFIAALKAGGARVVIESTLRPPERAYLMHWSWQIANGQVDPSRIPSMFGVDIEWSHVDVRGTYSRGTSVAEAKKMVAAFGMLALRVPPSLKSRHVEGQGIDMAISWCGTLKILDAQGQLHQIKTAPSSGLNAKVITVGATYGVTKYKGTRRDDPHWSIDGA